MKLVLMKSHLRAQLWRIMGGMQRYTTLHFSYARVIVIMILIVQLG